MSLPARCEALAMDEAALLAIERVPDCDEAATDERCGYALCEGCAVAFDAIMGVAESLRDLRDEELGGEA